MSSDSQEVVSQEGFKNESGKYVTFKFHNGATQTVPTEKYPNMYKNCKKLLSCIQSAIDSGGETHIDREIGEFPTVMDYLCDPANFKLDGMDDAKLSAIQKATGFFEVSSMDKLLSEHKNRCKKLCKTEIVAKSTTESLSSICPKLETSDCSSVKHDETPANVSKSRDLTKFEPIMVETYLDESHLVKRLKSVDKPSMVVHLGNLISSNLSDWLFKLVADNFDSERMNLFFFAGQWTQNYLKNSIISCHVNKRVSIRGDGVSCVSMDSKSANKMHEKKIEVLEFILKESNQNRKNNQKILQDYCTNIAPICLTSNLRESVVESIRTWAPMIFLFLTLILTLMMIRFAL